MCRAYDRAVFKLRSDTSRLNFPERDWSRDDFLKVSICMRVEIRVNENSLAKGIPLVPGARSFGQIRLCATIAGMGAGEYFLMALIFWSPAPTTIRPILFYQSVYESFESLMDKTETCLPVDAECQAVEGTGKTTWYFSASYQQTSETVW